MHQRKGIVLAGGLGSRLRPLTSVISKQLLPVYDKPMIYYPISVLMLADIQDILIISSPDYIQSYQNLLGDGSQFGVHFSYCTQDQPNGLAEAFIIGEDFISNSNPVLVLGDNIFYGQNFSSYLYKAAEEESGATIFGYKVMDPTSFGVVEVGSKSNAISIEEKPISPKSNIAVTGLYFYDSEVVEIAKALKPSPRGELEITSINQHYLEQKKLSVTVLGRGFNWLDTGTHESLLEASQFVHSIEKSQGFKVACLEEIAFNKGWLSKGDIEKNIPYYNGNQYGMYLSNILTS
jgi:glucose-1-phosphate thymidylyltransferase